MAPPRKRQRAVSPGDSAASPDVSGSKHAIDDGSALDDWTDEQEISLFKGVIRWKPAGMHKHFRMLSISQQLKSHGVSGPEDNHTRIPGIWSKLASIYNLEAIDEREYAFDADNESSDDLDEPEENLFYEFSLPSDEYGTLMFDRRLAERPSASPAQLDLPIKSHGRGQGSLSGAGDDTGMDDTEEEVRSTTNTKASRGSRAAQTPKSARPTASAAAAAKASAAKRRGRTSTRPAAPDKDTNETEEEDEDGEDEEEEDDEEEENEEDGDDSTNAGSPAARPGRRSGRAGPRSTRPQSTAGGGGGAGGGGSSTPASDMRRSSRRR